MITRKGHFEKEIINLDKYRKINNFPNYLINEYGKIYLIKRQRHLFQDKNGSGYLSVKLTNDKQKSKNVARIIPETEEEKRRFKQAQMRRENRITRLKEMAK
jgi:hypothetical protein